MGPGLGPDASTHTSPVWCWRVCCLVETSMSCKHANRLHNSMWPLMSCQQPSPCLMSPAVLCHAGVALYVACWRGADLRALVAGCSWAWLGTGLLSMGSLVGVGGRSSMWLITLVRPLITEVGERPGSSGRGSTAAASQKRGGGGCCSIPSSERHTAQQVLPVHPVCWSACHAMACSCMAWLAVVHIPRAASSSCTLRRGSTAAGVAEP